jgi:hypothetical protein
MDPTRSAGRTDPPWSPSIVATMETSPAPQSPNFAREILSTSRCMALATARSGAGVFLRSLSGSNSEERRWFARRVNRWAAWSVASPRINDSRDQAALLKRQIRVTAAPKMPMLTMRMSSWMNPRTAGDERFAVSWWNKARPPARMISDPLVEKSSQGSSMVVYIHVPVTIAIPKATHDRTLNRRATVRRTSMSSVALRTAVTRKARVMRPPVHTAAASRCTHLVISMAFTDHASPLRNLTISSTRPAASSGSRIDGDPSSDFADLPRSEPRMGSS